MVFAALLLTAGRLGDRIGRRRLFIAGVLVFIGGSLLAAMAEEAAPFIDAWVVQGIGGAPVLSTVQPNCAVISSSAAIHSTETAPAGIRPGSRETQAAI